MKRKMFSLLMVLVLCLTMLPAASAADPADARIDASRTASFQLWKYDITSANADGLQSTYVSTGLKNDALEEAMSAYALPGVVFSYLKIADITTDSAVENGESRTVVLYQMAKGEATNQLLATLGLGEKDAYRTGSSQLSFTSDILADALAGKLLENSSALKDALEAFAHDHNATAMPETDENGHSAASSLPLGLYLIVETSVPENVACTTVPFLVSLPMTTIDGTQWNYDVTVYPKNETDVPTLEKTLREAAADTGKNAGNFDGYAHTGTGSAGDTVEYQIISTLPTITSAATDLTAYTFQDTLSKGLSYNIGSVTIAWYRDTACTEKITTWEEADGKFVSSIASDTNGGSVMEISMTDAGLWEINGSSTVYGEDSLYHGYSGCTLRITYSCTVNSSADVVFGDSGNPNTVTLTWKRTSTDYYDTLTDDCHFYTYGVELTKEFSDDLGDFSKVQFVIYNETDGYWVTAVEKGGVYYVQDHVAAQENATRFTPTQAGVISVNGLEDDAYTITEVQTDAGYTLLKDTISLVISTSESGVICPRCGKSSLTASGAVNGIAVTMLENGGSVNALAPLTVVNSSGFDLPGTGDNGTWLLTIGGTLLICIAGAVVVCALLFGKKKNVR